MYFLSLPLPPPPPPRSLSLSIYKSLDVSAGLLTLTHERSAKSWVSPSSRHASTALQKAFHVWVTVYRTTWTGQSISTSLSSLERPLSLFPYPHPPAPSPLKADRLVSLAVGVTVPFARSDNSKWVGGHVY